MSMKDGLIYGGSNNSTDGFDPKDLTPREKRMAIAEGFVPWIYPDNSKKKHPTVGFGHKLTPEENKTHIINGKHIEEMSHEDFLDLYRQDIKKHDEATDEMLKARGIDISKLSGPTLESLHEMGYNLGAEGLNDFDDMLNAIKEGDYETAKKEALNTPWAEQVGDRSKDIAARFGQANPPKVSIPQLENKDLAMSVNESTPEFVKDLGPIEKPEEPKQEEKPFWENIGDRLSGAFDKVKSVSGFSDEEQEPEVKQPTDELEDIPEQERNEFIPAVPVELPKKPEKIEAQKATIEEDPDFPESEKVVGTVEFDEIEGEEPDIIEEEPKSVADETEKQLRPSREKLKAEKVVGDKLDKGLPGIDYIVDAKLVPEEMWKDESKSLDDIAKVMNENIAEKRRAINEQFRRDRDARQKDKWIIGLALGIQALANGMAARAQAVPDRIVNGRLIRGRPAGQVRPVDFSILKDLEKDIENKRAYRMKRAGLTLADAKFRFKIRKDARDLGIRGEKETYRRSEAARKEGKSDIEKLDKEAKANIKEENKATSRSHEQVLKDIQKAKPKKLEETVKNSLIANLGMDPDKADKFLKERNWLGNLLGSDVYGLGVSDKEKETLLQDVRSKMESELKDKPESSKVSDTIYDPKIHVLKKNKLTGEYWIWTKDNQKVAKYGKQ